MTTHPNRSRRTKTVRLKLPTARVWYDDFPPPGWFYKIGKETAVGPYATALDAGKHCREILLERAAAADLLI